MNDEEKIIDECLIEGGAIYKAPTKGNFTPTLVVGLGGTGTRVLRTLKKHLWHQRSKAIRLFGIDSDKTENGKQEDLPKLNESELCLLQTGRAISWLERYNAKDPQYKWLSGLLEETGPENSIQAEIRQKIQGGGGCGQRRRAGRLVLCSNIDGGGNVRGRLTEIHRDLRSLRAELAQIHSGFKMDESTRVFVVSSLAGGTGAGILIDTLALLRTIFDGPSDDITLIGLLPGSALDAKLYDARAERAITRGNAIGVLRELDALRSPGYKRTFQFGTHDRIEWNSEQHVIATNVYLVDNECGLLGGAPVTDWDALINATGYFLYNFCESGVGASQFSGQINYAPERTGKDNAAGVYRAFGISAVHYPVMDLIHAGLYKLAGDFLDEAITKPKNCVGEARDALKETMGALGLSGYDDLAGPFREIRIDEASFKQSQAQWKAIKWASDDEFIGAGQAALQSLRDGLPSYRPACDERVGQLLSKYADALEKRALRLVTGNHCVAREHFANLIKTLKGWSVTIHDELADLAGTLESSDKKIATLERKIHKWDFGWDWKLRAAYRTQIQNHLKTAVEVFYLGYAQGLLVSLTESARNLEARCGSIFATLSGKRLEYRALGTRVRESLKQGLFIQSGIQAEGLDDWLLGLDVARQQVAARELTLAGVLRPLFNPIVAAMSSSLSQSDIVSDAFSSKNRSGALKRLIKGTDQASQPLIALTSKAPHEEDLTPRRYVLSKSQKSMQVELSKPYPKVGDNTTEYIQLKKDAHSIACIRTVVGFKVADLKRFDEFYTCYAQKPWVFHTDEQHRKLPPLDPRMASEDRRYRIFGLALFFEAVKSSGSNYYANLIRLTREGQPDFQFVVYSKERGSVARDLLDKGIALEAPKSQTRGQDLISNQLEGAIETLSGSERASFSAIIDDVLESYVNTVGRAQAKQALTTFATDTIDGMLTKTKTKSGRKEALKRVRQALLEHADGIE